MKKFLLLLSLEIFSAFQVAVAGNITGTITLDGTPPPEVAYTPLMQVAYCASCYTNTPTTDFYVVGPKGELADVVVYLETADGKPITGQSTGASAPPALLDQKGCLYRPTILAIQTNQKLLVRNSDNCVHNVRCTPMVPGNPAHNDVQMPDAADLTYTFTAPEMFITFRCDIHPWMFAWVSVFDSPFYAVSDKDGKFIIGNVPPGKYILAADHRKLGKQTAEVEVEKAGSVTQDFTFKVKK